MHLYVFLHVVLHMRLSAGVAHLSQIRPYFKTIISILYVHTKDVCITNFIIKDTLIIGRYVKVLNITFMVINLS